MLTLDAPAVQTFLDKTGLKTKLVQVLMKFQVPIVFVIEERSAMLYVENATDKRYLPAGSIVHTRTGEWIFSVVDYLPRKEWKIDTNMNIFSFVEVEGWVPTKKQTFSSWAIALKEVSLREQKLTSYVFQILENYRNW